MARRGRGRAPQRRPRGADAGESHRGARPGRGNGRARRAARHHGSDEDGAHHHRARRRHGPGDPVPRRRAGRGRRRSHPVRRRVRVLLYTPSSKMLPEWRDALVRALPEGEVRAWEPGLAWRADYAALWYPAVEVLAGQTGLKAIFNLGAGVEALLKRIALPPGVPLIRIEDGGMARQMAEYVTWAVLRYFRRLDVYAAQQSRAEWKLHRPVRHADFPVGVMGVGVLGTHVARALAALGFRVLGWSRAKKQGGGGGG